jgi:hypothetical protein
MWVSLRKRGRNVEQRRQREVGRGQDPAGSDVAGVMNVEPAAGTAYQQSDRKHDGYRHGRQQDSPPRRDDQAG